MLSVNTSSERQESDRPLGLVADEVEGELDGDSTVFLVPVAILLVHLEHRGCHSPFVFLRKVSESPAWQ